MSPMKVTGSPRFAPRVAALGASASLVLVSGCSLLYNVDNLPAPPDDGELAGPPDVLDPDALMLATAGPPDLYEGQGADGSPQVFLVLAGSNISAQAQITLVPTDAADPLPMITLDVAHLAHAADNSVIALPVTLPVDPAAAGTDVKVTVHIKQTGKMGEDIAADLPGQVTIHTLPEIDDAHLPVLPLAARYAQIKLTNPLAFNAKLNAGPVILHSMSTIALSDVTSKTSGATPGQGGSAGGDVTKAGSGPGGGSPGNLIDLQHLNLLSAGTGGGFGAAAAPFNSSPGGKVTGDALITAYETNVSSGGGGGGISAGGGGGGTIELHAEGALTVGDVKAEGAQGGASNNILAGAGGGGSGGALVLRAGGLATLGALSVAGGPGGVGSGNNGTAGGVGRIRIDVPALAGTAPVFTATTRRGVAFAADTPLITRDKDLSLTLISDIGTDQYNVIVLKDVNTSKPKIPVVFTTPTQVISPALFAGYNRICVVPPSGSLTIVESTNCIELAYVPPDVANRQR